jgi:hypothetical protein
MYLPNSVPHQGQPTGVPLKAMDNELFQGPGTDLSKPLSTMIKLAAPLYTYKTTFPRGCASF